VRLLAVESVEVVRSSFLVASWASFKAYQTFGWVKQIPEVGALPFRLT